MNNIILILSSVTLNAVAQLLMKKAMYHIGEISGGFTGFISALPILISNFFVWLSFIIYSASILLWVIVLSKVEVSFAYPFFSIGYIVTVLGGYIFFSEDISFMRISGILCICIGTILVARS